MAFTYRRTVRFQDTDAAGVVYFATVLSICHEAYEASLAAAGVDLKSFFRGESIAVPIIHAAIDYFQPMFCGEEYLISTAPTRLSSDKFEIKYTLQSAVGNAEQDRNNLVSRATTLHLCINAATRSRVPLPIELEKWLASIPSNPDISPDLTTI